MSALQNAHNSLVSELLFIGKQPGCAHSAALEVFRLFLYTELMIHHTHEPSEAAQKLLAYLNMPTGAAVTVVTAGSTPVLVVWFIQPTQLMVPLIPDRFMGYEVLPGARPRFDPETDMPAMLKNHPCKTNVSSREH